jgi:TonB-dependent receptor
MYKQISLFLLVAVLPFSLFAAKISGTVKDAKDGSALIGVIVNIKNTNKAATTDPDGNYEIKDVEDGKYELAFSLISYQKQTEKIMIEGNKDVVVNISLKSDDKTALKEVSISGTKVTRTENAVLMEIRKSSSIVSGISAAQIGKTMDRNAADVVKRIPGVTIQDDRFIIVRGLADRYNSVWLNDAGTPSSETDKKSFSFDLIPSGLIDRVLVFKTPSPELPGDFAGGMVKIYTTSMPDKNQYSVGVQTSYRQNSTGTSFNYEPKSSTDWLGYDDGKRALPSIVPAENVLANNPQNDAIAKSFGANNWTIKNKTLAPDLRVNVSASNVFKIKKVKLGNTFGASYSNVSTNYQKERMDWDSTDLVFHYKDLQSKTKVSVGLLDNMVAIIGNSKIEFKNLYNQIGEGMVTKRTSVRDTDANRIDANDELGYLINYESRATYCSQLSGTHKSTSDKWKYNWTLGYSDLFKNQPDSRRLYYTKGVNDTIYKAQMASAGDPFRGGGIFYAKLFEHVYSFNHQFSYKLNIGDHFFDLNIGNYLEYKNRDYSSRSFAYGYKAGIGNPFDRHLFELPIDQIFADENMGKGKFQMIEKTDSTYNYSSKNKLLASFISTKFMIGSKINVLGGARYEYNIMSLNGYADFNHRTEPEVITKYLLPSVNVSYNFNEKSLVRVAYGKTLNRPEFREWAPSQYYDWETLSFIYGSLHPNGAAAVEQSGDTLKVSSIDNIDVRWEWYPSAGEMVHIGGFYKKLKDPIQKIIYDGANRSFAFSNQIDAYTAGIEIEARKNLMFFDDVFNTNTFKDITIVGNVTAGKSQLTPSKAGILTGPDALDKAPLQGQSPYTINLGAFYQNDSINFQTSLLYNVYGPRLYALGTKLRSEESIGELPFHSLDLVIAKTFFKHYMLNFGLQNILDSKVVFVKDIDRNGKFDNKTDKEWGSYKMGRYFSVGLKVKF